MPFAIALVVWQLFPPFASFILIDVFCYPSPTQPSALIWSLPLSFFYTWYVFFSIGVSGFLVVASWVWKQQPKPKTERSYPMVSFLVPAHNEEKNIMRCIKSLFECTIDFRGSSEIIVVDDGSTDNTYEVAWTAINARPRKMAHIHAKVVRHTANLGKAEALRTGVNRAMGEYVAVVDADTFWERQSLTKLVDYMHSTKTLAASGYIHPSDGLKKRKLFVILQQLEYSQGLGILRRAEALGSAITVVPGPMGLYRSEVLRQLLNEKEAKSVTEDLEFTLEMQKKNMKLGYEDDARSSTVAPKTLKGFWRQRLRWSIGWLHNQLAIHRDLLWNKRWLTLLLWYSLVPGIFGAVLELVALLITPVFFWFAPDRVFFLLNLVLFMLLVLVVGLVHQAIALKFSYSNYNHRQLLRYMPLYFLLRLIIIFAKCTTLIQYTMGKKGIWHKS